ncbi:MAG: hypothetical protein U5L96_16610 [Owenweeksia sp.]|nr:hypothetical protein [Owenweeksia sp.]
MRPDVKEMREKLTSLLMDHQGLLEVAEDSPEKFEVQGTVPTMQGKKQVDGIYFASVVPKPKDVRLYFFPIYTHAADFKGQLPQALRKSLKGKSCFHLKKIDEEQEQNLRQLITRGVELYKKDGLL